MPFIYIYIVVPVCITIFSLGNLKFPGMLIPFSLYVTICGKVCKSALKMDCTKRLYNFIIKC